MVHLDYRDARPIYTQICDGIRDQILSGILRPDDRLPSVRELATQLTINPNTIQRAYRELEAQGFIASVPGKGCFVCSGNRHDRHQPLWDAFDEAIRQLQDAGVTKEELLRHIQQGGNRHA